MSALSDRRVVLKPSMEFSRLPPGRLLPGRSLFERSLFELFDGRFDGKEVTLNFDGYDYCKTTEVVRTRSSGPSQ